MSVIPVNAEPVPMTAEQKFVFDLKGWLLVPGVLEPDLLEALREHLYKLKQEPESLPPYERYSLAGPAQELIDHPAVVGILREIIAPDPSPDAYGFRCESSFAMLRAKGQAGSPPHCGPIVGPLAYRVLNGRIWSGLTRVVWELSEVKKDKGGTPIMSGSHKSNFPVPEAYREYDPAMYESYACPPASVLIFSESCWHYGVEWKDSTGDRLAIFNCYSSYLTQWHKMNLPAEVIERMPAKRQTAFRGVWGHNFHEGRHNDYYADDNQAL
ncbi:MAG: phytanoyl-CoA dioxygenase [Candidatus Poribacteria bacterium]|nr:phytanoyl-CoA dioxygenase [Candidatus Poribacteria bacterium]